MRKVLGPNLLISRFHPTAFKRTYGLANLPFCSAHCQIIMKTRAKHQEKLFM